MKKLQLISLALLGSALLSLGWPQSGFPGLLFIGFIPFLALEDHVLRNREQYGRLTVFFYTYLGFLSWNLLTTWWIWNSSATGAILAYVLNSLFMAFVFHIYHNTRKQLTSGKGYFVLVFFWITFEYLHHHWDGNWPWLSLGNGFAEYIKWIQWYEYTGIFGGTAWILIVNILLYKIISSIYALKKVNSESMVNGSMAIVLIIVPIIISHLIFSNYREEERPVDIVVVQPNIDPYNEQYSLPVRTVIDKNLDLALQLMESTTEYIVSPESAIQDNIWERNLSGSMGLRQLKDFMRSHPGPEIIIGASTAREYLEGEKISATARKFRDADKYYDSYNTGLYLTRQGTIEIHHKSRLTPGVEKMPFPELFKPLQNLAIDLGGTVGSLGMDEERTVFIRQKDSLCIAPVICYESVFGEYVTEYIHKGAELIFVITNDGWWGNTPGHKQHFTFSRLRAIETRRSVARSANTGTSAFINQRGESFQMTGYWVPAVIRQSINANDKITFYVRYGDYIARVSGLVTVFLLLIALSIRLRRKSKVL